MEQLIAQNTCDKHKSHDEEDLLSPCRYKCKKCSLKIINGYSNPDHVSNPFGYLYLAPMLCDKCSIKMNKCRWCNIT
jgi:hypothetical protein